MASQQQQQRPQQTAPAAEMTPEAASALLDKVLEATGAARKTLDTWFEGHEEKIEELLPDHMKGQARRFCKRAVFTFSNKPELQKCSAASFVKCVLGAAELGLAIDGRLAHAVPYKGEASLQIDYKGIIAVARRTKIIRDCYARIVYDGDDFEASDEDGECHLRHKRTFESKTPLFAYAVIKLPDGEWRYELMDMQELDEIRKRSAAWRNAKGPWTTDDLEMRKKTVIKRALKTYCDDPAIIRALEIDDRDYEEETEPQPERKPIPMPKAKVQPKAPPKEAPLDEGDRHEHDDERDPEPKSESSVPKTEMGADNESDRIAALIKNATTPEGFDYIEFLISRGEPTFGDAWAKALRRAAEEAKAAPAPKQQPTEPLKDEAAQAQLEEFLKDLTKEAAEKQTTSDLERGTGGDIKENEEWLKSAGAYDRAMGIYQTRFKELSEANKTTTPAATTNGGPKKAKQSLPYS